MTEETPDNVVPFSRAALEVIERRATVESSAVVRMATELSITDPETFVAAGELRKEVNRRDALLETEFKGPKQSLDKAKRDLLDFERKVRAPFGEARSIIDTKIIAYNAEQERIRRDEEDRVREAARKLEEERKLRAAEDVVATGGTQEEALAVLEEPSTAPAPFIPSSVPKVGGLAIRETWSAEVTDLHRLIQYVAMHPEYVNLLVANGTALNALARAQREALAIPGVRAVKKEGVSGSRR